MSIVLITVGLGYFSQLVTRPISVDFTVLFMLLLLILYVALKKVELK